MTEPVRYAPRLTSVTCYAVAMALVEAVVVVYLRDVYYPDGFTFPLRFIPFQRITLEVGREAATLVMLAAVGYLAGRALWERFGWFMLAFGVWDIWYYLWLRIVLNWPATLFDWDILFLIPLPWIGPVIAPVLIAVEMCVVGFLITRRYAAGRAIHPPLSAWVLAGGATALLLWSFMRDLDAGLHQAMPRPYPYPALFVGLVLYAAAWARTDRAGGA